MEKDILFSEGKRTTIIAALTTIFFALAKAVIGFFSGSIVLIADAIHSLADSVSAFFVWVGFKIAQREPTEKFPYGFYKAENITALLISFLILFAGYEIIERSVDRLFVESYQLNIPFLAIGIAFLDAVVMFLIGSYEIKIGRKINSQSLIADGKESKTHILSSSMVLVGLFSAWSGIFYLEGIMGILISLFIFKVGIDSLKDSVFALMDVSPSKEIDKRVRKILNDISGIRGFESLKLRKAGPFVFGEVKIKIGKTVNVKRAHEISESIEREIKKKVASIDYFSVIAIPYQTQKQKICIPVKENKGTDSLVSDHFGRAEKIIFLKVEGNEIKDYYVKSNPNRGKEKRAGLNTALFVMKEKIDIIITKEMGPISFHTLRDNVVDVLIGKGENVQEVIDNFFKGELKLLGEPTKEKK